MKINNLTDFDKANKVIHNVDVEWFYKVLTKYGWTTIVRELPGFVRHYEFTHDKFPNSIINASVGAKADHWEHLKTGKKDGGGYHNTLQPFLDEFHRPTTVLE